MNSSLHLRFEGLEAPVLFEGCDELLPFVEAIMPGWPCAVAAADRETVPCATLSREADGRYACVGLDPDAARNDHDAVNAICDLIVELSGELLRSGRRLMCLHGAAVAFGDRLVVLPNSHRAGKSTLTACLAARGQRVFSDDFFPVDLDGAGHFLGAASGICPRLRLPVPDALSEGFRDWVAANPAPANRQYKYLALPDLPPHGERLPLGAIVFLDRGETEEVRLGRVDATSALETLLHQNFARAVHSETILRAMKPLLSVVPVYRLSYRSAEEAASELQRRLGDWPGPPPVLGDAPDFELREVDEADLAAAPPGFDPALRYVQAPGFYQAELDGEEYLTDGSGLGIHRLNRGALAIWTLLEEPMRRSDVVDILCEAFPATPAADIERDSTATMRSLAENRLIVPA